MAKITDIEGIGEAYAQKLKDAGVASVEGLLEKGASAAGRQALVEQTGISEALLLRWVNHADLFRIKGIGSEYAELLEAAGVDSVPELAQRRADNLCAKMLEVNRAKRLVRKPPVQTEVAEWITQARQLAKIVTH